MGLPTTSAPEPAPRPSAVSDDGLYTRLTILTASRLAIVSVLLVVSSFLVLRPGDELSEQLVVLLYGLIGFVYVASIGYLWMLRRRRNLPALAWAQVAGDIGVATFLVYLTGGADSLFVLMYPLAIVNASALHGQRGAVVAAATSAVSFASLVVALDRGTLEPAAEYLTQRPLTRVRLVTVSLANGSAFLLTAALSAYLTAQVRRAGERLSEREVDYAALAELHGSIVRNMASGIVTTDPVGRITFLNPSGERIAGARAGRILGAPLSDVLPGLAGAVVAAIEAKQSRGEVDEKVPGGGARRLGFVVTRLDRVLRRRGADDSGLAIIFEDLTALRAMEEAVRRGDRLAAVGGLAAGLAHELRNPLASMSGAVELLARGKGLDDSERRLAEIVLREAQRLNALVTDFLTFARPAPPVLARTDLGALVDEVLGVSRHGPASRRLRFERSGLKELWVEVDAAQLRQVVWNLLQNGVDALHGREHGRLVVTVEEDDGEARILVSDDGPGIPAEHRARVFEPFFTTKNAGTGLGLALVYRIVEAHGGRVELAPGGEGATFIVRLPVKRPPAVAIDGTGAPAAA